MELRGMENRIRAGSREWEIRSGQAVGNGKSDTGRP